MAAAAILLSGLAVVANEQYIQSQISIAAAAESAIELGEKRIGEVSAALDDLELAIQNAQEIVTQTVGQTLDDQELEALMQYTLDKKAYRI